MLENRVLQRLNRAFFLFFTSISIGTLPVWAADNKQPGELRIDIPVELTQAKVVFNMDHPAFEADNPTGLNYMAVMVEHFAKDKTQSSLIAIFHGDIGYMLLSDESYNRARHTNRGNPYKTMIKQLQAKGVQFEECGQTAHAKGWGNADFMSGIRVNTSANLRIVQLVQQGYIQIQP